MNKEPIEKDAAYYLEQAQNHKAIAKEQRLAFFHVGLFVAIAVFALVIFSLSWFVSNSQVGGQLGGISATNLGVEIGSRGKAGVHDDWLKKVDDSLFYHLPDGDLYKHDTSLGGNLNWLLNDTSNMKNNLSEDIQESGAINRKDYAIEPGTKGNLDFFIKPEKTGDLSLDLEIEMLPFCVEVDDTYRLVDKKEYKSILGGHILYFLKTNTGTTQDPIYTYTWIKDGRFHIDIKDAQKDQEYDFSIYWVWPLNLSTILLNESDPFLNGLNNEFDDVDHTKALREAVIADMTKNPEKYFYSSLKGTTLDTSYAEVKEIPTIYATSGSTNDYQKQLFVDLASYYNQADMEIGKEISFITVTLRLIGRTELTGGTPDGE